MINLETYLIDSIQTFEEGGKFLHNKFRDNKERFIGRWLEPLQTWLTMNGVENYKDIINFYEELWDTSEKYSYEEAFKINNTNLRALVFSVIDVPEMISYLGTSRIKTDGVELINKTYNNGRFELNPYTQVYELHKVNGEGLGLNEDLYAIKCWCTSTNSEHWLWTTKELGYKGDPLEAIAATCHYYNCMEGKIKSMIRQGDVYLFEMKDDFKFDSASEIKHMNKKQYFELLKTQS